MTCPFFLCLPSGSVFLWLSEAWCARSQGGKMTHMYLQACPEPFPRSNIYIKCVHGSHTGLFLLFAYINPAQKLGVCTPCLAYKTLQAGRNISQKNPSMHCQIVSSLTACRIEPSATLPSVGSLWAAIHLDPSARAMPGPQQLSLIKSYVVLLSSETSAYPDIVPHQAPDSFICISETSCKAVIRHE